VNPHGPEPPPAEGDGLRFLRLALLIIAIGVSCYGLLLYIVAPEQYYRSVGPLLLLPVALVALILLQRGSATAALRVLTFGVWTAVTIAAVFAGGVRAPALATYPLLIVMAGWLLGLRTGILMAGLSLASSALLALAESGGILLRVHAAPAVLVWLVQAIVYITAAVLIALVLHRYDQRFRQVRQLGDALSGRVADLAAKEAELRLLAENIPAFIFHGGVDLRCRFANHRYAEFFGFTPQNVIGRHVSEILGEDAMPTLQPRLEAVLSGETVHYRTVRRSAADGEEHTLDITFVPERDEAGNVAGFYALKLDVTAEVRARQALTEQHAFQEALVRAQSEAGLAMFIIESGRFTYANEAACRMFGYSLDELRALPSFLDLTHPDDRERIVQNHQRRLRGEKFENNYRIAVLTRAGERREADLTAAQMPGEPPRVLVILADATERKRIEDELLRSERKFSRVFQHSPVPISITRMTDGRFIDVNEAWTRLFGWTRAQVVGRSSFDLGLWPNPEDRQAWIAAMQRPDQLASFETKLRNKDGRILSILFSSEMVELDDEPCLLALSIDLTEQKRAEAALVENEKRLRDAQRSAHLGNWELDLSGNAFAFSAEIGNIYEIQAERDAVTYEDFLGTLPRSEREDFNRQFGEVVRSGGKGEYSYRPRMRDGRIKHVHVRYETQRDELGKPLKVIGTTQDVTNLVIAEERFAKIFQASPLPATITRADTGRFVDVNPAAVRFGGWSRQEMIGLTSVDLNLWPDPRQRQQALDTLLRDGSLRDLEVTYRRRSGELRDTLISAEVVELEGARCILTLIHDVTDRRRAEEAVRRLNDELEARVQSRTAELLAANKELESFAYSISHDLRAPLRGIDGFSHLLAEEYAERLDDTGRGYLERVRRAAQRMGELIDDILELSRVTRQDMRRVAVDLSQVAAEVIEERARAEPERKVEVAIESGCTAQGDPQLLRVLMQNLLENAWKYTRRTEPARIAFGRETRDGETVFFVRDNGVGFDMQYAERLFAPFQRLHRPEEFEGTGIGLATVARVTHRHGGRVWAEAETDKGAVFRFTLAA
jgi:PAS domain S-box-containing protein